MYYEINRNILGFIYSEKKKNLVWEKGITYPGLDENRFRNDKCGNLMKYDEYGNTLSGYGWEIDHIYPKSKGGTDDINNLQPLYWENNRAKADKTGWEWGNEEIHLDENSKSIYKVRKDGIF